MKRTSAFLALLFGALLWLSPANAQKTRIAADQVGVAMDKAPLAKENVAMDRQAVAKAEMLPLLKQSDVKSARELNLSDKQKKEMVKAYMQEAMQPMQVGATKAGEQSAASVFMASAFPWFDGTSLNYYPVSFTMEGNTLSAPERLSSFPYGANGFRLFPMIGTWAEDYFEGFWWGWHTSTNKLYYFGYYYYNPAIGDAGELENLDTLYYASAISYDYVSEKVYALMPYEPEDETSSDYLCLWSADPGQGNFTFSVAISSLPEAADPVAMAIDKTGVLYVIGKNGDLYSIDKTTGVASRIGATGRTPDNYFQSATVDYRTGDLYWVCSEAASNFPLFSKVNTETGEAQTVSATLQYAMGALSSIYYATKRPADVEVFGASYDGVANKVTATFITPEKDINGDPLPEGTLLTAYLYCVAGNQAILVDSVENAEPGKLYSVDSILEENTTLTSLKYAIKVKDTKGLYSPNFVTAEAKIIAIALPYQNGFEADEVAKMVIFDVQDILSAGGIERTQEEKYAGEWGYKLTSNYTSDLRMLNLVALPQKRGGVYQWSFFAKTTPDNVKVGKNVLYIWYDGDLVGTIQIDSAWKKVGANYSATVTGQWELSFCAMTPEPFYIDDFEYKEVSSPNVPGLLTINNIAATENNALSAIMNITLPSLAISDEPLASVTGVVVQYADDASFAEYKVDSIKTGLSVGATDDFTIQIEKAGQYYFRAYAYNEFGRCPQFSTYANRSPWLGPKNMPVSMATATVNEDGDVKVEWTEPAIANEISWTANGKSERRLTIDGESAFKYAQSFTSDDLASYGMTTPKALQIGFVPGSETADYKLVLAYEGTEEIYSKEIDKADLKEGEWYYTTVDETITIDVTKELWVIVEVAESENQGYACAATATTVAEGKSNKMWMDGTWTTISTLFTNSPNASVLVSLKAEDPATTMASDNGYKIYRGKIGAAFEDYDSITMVTTNNYIDTEWKDMEFGRYNYAVVAAWEEADATPVMTNVLNKDMKMTMTFAITSNAGSAEGAEVAMIGAAEKKLLTAVADGDGKVVFEEIWRDKYTFEVVLPFHKYYFVETFDLTKDTLVNVALEEIIVDPELIANVEGKNVVINYGVNMYNWVDDVESYTDFAIENIGDYILSAPVAKIVLNGYTWNNYNKPQSWIVLNSATSQPAFLPAHSGDKMFVAWRNSDGTQNNDYLIRPVGKGGGVLQFYRRGTNASNPESFDVVYSSTTADLTAFKTVKTYRNVNNAWTEVRVDIPEDAKYVGIHYNADNQFGLFIDDLSYLTEDAANPTGYEIYLNGEKVKDAKVDELTYTFEDLAVGEYKVGVKAIYASGESEMVEKTVKISAEAMPINLNVAVDERTAVLTWNMPEGFEPKSYKVFLGEELKAEDLTEKTYTFEDLANGKYTAAVVAVYETGESEKATVEFTINSRVDVEDLDMTVRSSVYPNPNNGMFYLQAADKGMVEVYTMNGKIVKRMMLPAEGVYTIDLQNGAKGMYLVRFMTANSASYFKVMVR